MEDLIIVGGGPAGLTAGIYAQRARLKTLLLEKLAVGGQIALSDLVENYPGFPSLKGVELVQRFEEHAAKFELEVRKEEVLRVRDEGNKKIVETNLFTYKSKAVIVASGAQPKKLMVPGEKELTGRGVSYCATCDGPFFTHRDVVVVGGGDAAVKEALFLSKIVNRIYLVHRRDTLRAEKIIQERAFSNSKIEFIWNSVVEEIAGKDMVERVIVRNVKSGGKRELRVEGVFIFVGIVPNTAFIEVDKDRDGFIQTDGNLETSIKGTFAAGDCRAKLLRQVATAVGDGALAAFGAERYIESLKI